MGVWWRAVPSKGVEGGRAGSSDWWVGLFQHIEPSHLGGGKMVRIRICFVALTAFVGLVVAVQGAASRSQPVIPKLIAAGQLKPAVIHLKNGQIKRMPFFSGGVLSTLEQGNKHLASAPSSAAGSLPGVSVDSLGCSDRA